MMAPLNALQEELWSLHNLAVGMFEILSSQHKSLTSLEEKFQLQHVELQKFKEMIIPGVD